MRRVGHFVATYGIYVALLLLFLFLCMRNSEHFLTARNLENVLRQNAFTVVLAVGMTLAILTAGIDLSVGSVVALSGVYGAAALVHGAPILVAVLCGLAVGAAVGLCNGLLVTWVRVPPFLSSLGMMLVVRGFAYKHNGPRGVPLQGLSDDVTESFSALSNGWMPTAIMLSVVVLAWLLLTRTAFGRHVYAVGGNREAAHLAGIRVSWVLIRVYVLCGLAAGLAGVMVASRIGSGLPSSGVMYELDAVAAVVVGGTSLFGGRGSVWGTLAGAFFIGILNNGLNLNQIDAYDQQIIKGLVLIGATSLDLWRGGKAA